MIRIVGFHELQPHVLIHDEHVKVSEGRLAVDDGRDVADNMDLYIIMLVLSSVFPITWFIVPIILGTQWFLGLFKGRKK